jgi:flavodoxin
MEIKLSKSIVVYYSFSGNTRLIAEKISKSLQSEMFELIPQKKIELDTLRDKEFFKSCAKCIQLKDMSQYNHIIIGTPVWARTIPPPVRWFIENTREEINGKVSFFCCHAGVIGDTFNYIQDFYKEKFYQKKGFYQPLNNLINCFKEADKWIEELKK